MPVPLKTRLLMIFYRRNLPPCEGCGEETFRCACARFEAGAPARA